MPYTLQLLHAPFGVERTRDLEIKMRDVLEAELGGDDAVAAAIERDSFPSAPGSPLAHAESEAWNVAFSKVQDWDSDLQADYIGSTTLEMRWVSEPDRQRWIDTCIGELSRLGAKPSNAHNIAAFAGELWMRIGYEDPIEVARQEWADWPLDDAGDMPIDELLAKLRQDRLSS